MSRSASLRRIGWTAASQVASSASNLAFTIIVARSLGTAQLGTFAILMAMFSIGIGLVRAFSSEPMIFREAAVGDFEKRDRYGSALAGGFLSSILVALAIFPLCLAFSIDPVVSAVFAVVIPVVVGQDTVRFVLNDLKLPKWALAIEVLWLGVQLPLMIVLGSGSLQNLLLCWGLGGLVSVVVGLVVIRARVRVMGGVRWLMHSYRIGSIYFTDFLVSSGVNQLTVFLLVLFAGFDAAGELRAAQILLTPLMVFTLGVSFAVGPESARLAQRKQYRTLRKIPLLYGGGVVLFGIGTVLVALLVPGSVLGLIMGDSAIEGARLVPIAAAAVCIMGLSVGSGIVLRSIGHVKVSTLAKIAIAPFTLLLVGFGSAFAGAAGSQAGLCVGNSARTVTAAVLLKNRLPKQPNTNEGGSL